MPFVFAIVGVLLLIIAIRGTHQQAFGLLQNEFTGSNSFVVFVAAIVVLGAFAYIRPIRPIAFGLIGLVLLAIVLKNKGGFIAQFNNAIRNPVQPAATPASGTGTPVVGVDVNSQGQPFTTQAPLGPGLPSITVPQPGTPGYFKLPSSLWDSIFGSTSGATP